MTQTSRGKGRTETGTVVSAGKAAKTIRVELTRLVKHPRYHKYVKGRKSFLVHDETEKAALGDIVRIIESRPHSKRKRWRLLDIIEREKVDFEPIPGAADVEPAVAEPAAAEETPVEPDAVEAGPASAEAGQVAPEGGES
ncbi:MAG: 30S ribosomal protein S17 [Planctomycetota bacterium]|nr:MAG: 30S ribosomal protein S17 [Planctomycetota bacterium]